MSVLILSWVISCASITLAQKEVNVGDQFTLYVSTSGNDTWSGRLAEPNVARTDGPLATIQKARNIVREFKIKTGGSEKPVTIALRGGVYRQVEPVVFTTEDSGTVGCPVVYHAYPGEKPVISGGHVILDWRADDSLQSKTRCGGKLWRASVPGTMGGGKWRFNQLFVNGHRRTRARIPNKGSFLRTDGPISDDNRHGFYFQHGEVKEWDNLSDAIFVVYHSWETSIHHARSVDTVADQVTFWEPAPWAMGRWEREQRYYIENVFEELDEPGEWYLNQATGTLYYYPLPGETMANVEAVAPTLTSTLVRFDGDASKGEFVEHLHFKGISFQHSNAKLRRLRNPGQGEIYQSGLVMATGLRHTSFEDCEIAHTGAHAIWLAEGCEDVSVQHCHIHDLGGGGVYIGGGWAVHENPAAQRISVDNNFIHDGSHLFHGAHGVWIGKSSFNAVTHNEISNFDYSGISCGWSWGFQASSAHHNKLDYNHIHHLGNGDGLSDMGGIYTLGVSPGTTVRNNQIHHIFNYAPVSHGSGIYPDEGSSGILIENNLVYRVRACPLTQHYGKDNIVRNNILALGGKGQLHRSREDQPCHYIAEGNIIYTDIEQMLGGVWKNGDWKIGRNVYWSTVGKPRFMDMDFATWKTKAHDVGSIISDPLFVDVARDDFRLKPDSPALQLGFKPIDFSQTGLYGDKEWGDLPGHFPNRSLNEISAPIITPLIINFDFEGDDPGAEPLDGTIVKIGKQASLAVSSDTAASGSQSLKFSDAPADRLKWTPHIYYQPSYKSGKLQLSWDMFNSREAPARFYVEVRQWDEDPFLVGPTVSVAPDGTVNAGGQHIGKIPLAEWVNVNIELKLGDEAPSTYLLTLDIPNRKPIVTRVPYVSREFKAISWLGISSTNNTETVFYIDNLKLGTASELAQPLKRRSARRLARGKPRGPGNSEMLVGYWKFDDMEGYAAIDSSGYGNHGDVQAAWANGAFGSAIFSSPTGNISIRDDPTLQFGTSDFSIELWICPTELKIDSNDQRRRFMDKSNFPHTWWNMNITPDGKPFLEMTDENRSVCANRPTGVIPANAWTHFVVVVDRTNGKTRYYYDGKLDSSQNIPGAFTGSLDVKGSDLSIGSGWQPFIGLLDEVKIYKRVLTDAEIKDSYDNEKVHRTNIDYKLVE